MQYSQQKLRKDIPFRSICLYLRYFLSAISDCLSSVAPREGREGVASSNPSTTSTLEQSRVGNYGTALIQTATYDVSDDLKEVDHGTYTNIFSILQYWGLMVILRRGFVAERYLRETGYCILIIQLQK